MFLLAHDYWKVKKTKEKGLGVFACKPIHAGTVIGDYLGKVIRIADYDQDADNNELFLMCFTDEAFIYPDVSQPGIHLINHSCKPNCWIYIYCGHTLFFALRDISAGEELSISYLLSPDDGTCRPCTHVCKCTNVHCTGTMHLPEHTYVCWQKFQNKQRKETRRAPFKVGEYLPRLTLYPERIRIDPIYQTLSGA